MHSVSFCPEVILEAELYPIGLFSPEISFVPLKLDLRVRGGEKEKRCNA